FPPEMELPELEEVEADAARVAELVKYFEQSKDWEAQDKVFEMLQRIDRMHRACIWRLYQLTSELGGGGLMERIEQDPVIKTLFVLYDLLPPQSPYAEPEPQQSCSGTMRILIAGVGNVLRGDDAFGIEVLRQLQSSIAVDGVQFFESGIAGI